MTFKETKQALEAFAKTIIKQSKGNLRRHRNNKFITGSSSGDLEGSLGYDLNVSPNSFSLEFLADVIHVLLKIGFLLLSIGVISGLCIYLFSVAGSKYKFKLIWSVLIWGWYCGILLAYNFSYCSRKRIAEMSVLGCSLLIGSLFGVGFK